MRGTEYCGGRYGLWCSYVERVLCEEQDFWTLHERARGQRVTTQRGGSVGLRLEDRLRPAFPLDLDSFTVPSGRGRRDIESVTTVCKGNGLRAACGHLLAPHLAR